MGRERWAVAVKTNSHTGVQAAATWGKIRAAMPQLFTGAQRRAIRALKLAAIIVLAGAAFAPVVRPAESKPATILLVGASGMIGSRILTEAAGRGHPVIAAARHPERIASGANIRAVQLDATDAQAFIILARQAGVIVMATSPRGGGDPMKEARALAPRANVSLSSAAQAVSRCPTADRSQRRCRPLIAPRRSPCAVCSTH
jgi:hypothetical protein